MKRNIIILLLFIPFLSISQPFIIPLPLTDSLTNNRNPDIRKSFAPQGLGGAVMFWEKSTDSTSTSIFMKYLNSQGYPPSAEQLVISQSGVHFTHPVMFNLTPTFADTLYYLFFETDQNGNKDIFYLKYDTNGIFDGPFPFATGPYDDINLRIADGTELSQQRGIVWESNHAINYSRLLLSGIPPACSFAVAQTLDSGDVSEPVINNQGNRVWWLKKIGDSTKIAFAVMDEINFQWSSPQLLTYAGNFSCLSVMRDGNINMGCDVLNCKNIRNDGQRIMSYDAFDLSWSETQPSSFAINNPSGLFAPLFVKGASQSELSGCTMNESLLYSTDSTGNEEIMLYPHMIISNWHINLSEYSGIDINPKGFLIWGMDSWYLGESMWVWESFRNGHWQLYYTYADIMGGIDEPQKPVNEIDCYPNPFVSGTAIEVENPDNKNLEVSIFNGLGERVKTLQVAGKKGNKEVYNWDGCNTVGNKQPAGMYLLIVRNSDGMLMNKKLFKI